MSQSNNIIIGNPGLMGQSNTTMIGNTQTSTYVEGIYSNVLTGASPVYVDNTGQLGTTSSDLPSNLNTYPFFVYQVGQTGLVLGTGTEYYMGSEVVLTKLFDIGSNFTVGTGSGAGKSNAGYFTAPVAGIYMFMSNIFYALGASGINGYVYIQTTFEAPTVTYEYNDNQPASFSGGYYPRYDNNFWRTVQANINLNAGDKVYFGINILVSPITGSPFLAVKVGNSADVPANSYGTRICGFKVY